jgi:N-acetylmuramoyl-L-alanine amidase
MKLLAAMAIPFFALLAQAPDRPLRTVYAVRHWVSGDILRVAIEVSGDFDFRGDFLHNPERAYYDIPKSRPNFDSRRVYSEEIEGPLLKRIRIAETVPGVTRIVFDLNGDVQLNALRLSNPYRLVVELSPIAPATALPAPPVTPVAPPVRKWHPPEEKKVGPAPTVLLSLAPSPVVRAHNPEFLPFRAEPPKLDAPPPAPAPPPPVAAAEPVKSPPSPAASETPKPARRTSAGTASLTRALGLKLNRVVIDPGHGGHDQGTAGDHGLIEKELVLDVSLRLGKLIAEQLGAEVIYTRTDDSFVALERRPQLANEKKADLFLSIHANSSPYPSVSGVETYVLNFTDSRSALDVAMRENASSQKSMSELHDIIQKITAHDKAQESKEFASKIQASLYAFSARSFPGEYDRGVKQAPFVVLIGTTMPAVLTEIGFVTNAKEEALLKRSDYRQKLADAIFHGVAKYAETLSHFDTDQPPPGK